MKHLWVASQTKEAPQTEIESSLERPFEIVLHNDDVNTFDHVIAMLVRYCDHDPQQAHQCALLVHFKGSCSVKTGDYDDLRPRCEALLEAGLSATIDRL